MRTYAIGDIHGRLALLRGAHALIEADRRATGDRGAPVVHVGDLVDRGPDSRGAIEHLMAGQARGEPWVVLKGNHDRMFAGFLDDPAYHDSGLRRDLAWMHPRLGGAATLASYGVPNAGDRPVAPVRAEAVAAVPSAHRAWIAGLPLMLRRGEAVFVHAGILPGVPLDRQVEDDLLWIREPFLSDRRDFGALVVHGHTVVERVAHHGNRVNLDTGAGYGGPLSAVVIEGRAVFLLTEAGRVPVPPRS